MKTITTLFREDWEHKAFLSDWEGRPSPLGNNRENHTQTGNISQDCGKGAADQAGGEQIEKKHISGEIQALLREQGVCAIHCDCREPSGHPSPVCCHHPQKATPYPEFQDNRALPSHQPKHICCQNSSCGSGALGLNFKRPDSCTLSRQGRLK